MRRLVNNKYADLIVGMIKNERGITPLILVLNMGGKSMQLYKNIVDDAKIGFLVLILVLLFGCGNAESGVDLSSDISNTENKKQENQANVLVKVGDKELKTTDLLAESELRCQLELIRNPKIREKALENIRKRISSTAVKYFVTSTLSSEYIKENNIIIDSKTREEHIAKLLKSFKINKIEDIKNKLPEYLVNRFESGIERTLIVDAARNAILNKANINVSEEQVDKALERYTRANEKASLTNALVYAHASNVWNRIVAKKRTFDEAAFEYSEIEGEATQFGLWGSFKESNFESDEEKPFKEWLLKAKLGDISPPLVVDSGLCITRLDSVSHNDDQDSDSKNYALSRIYFRLPVIWEIPTKSEMRKIIFDAEKNRAIEKAFSELAKRHKVVYSK